jgi:hypothetical protein
MWEVKAIIRLSATVLLLIAMTALDTQIEEIDIA